MELSIKIVFLFSAVILTGLSAGFFYAWQVSVISGTKQLQDETYLVTMQTINRAILNPAFFSIFFGPLIIQGITCIYEFHSSKLIFGLTLAAFFTYLIGAFGVTLFGNVPLNNRLDALSIAGSQLAKLTEFRMHYESTWNRLHLIRTSFSLISFLLIVLSVFTQLKE